jgi:glycosyltransferase involved in cell wall biosynthesis
VTVWHLLTPEFPPRSGGVGDYTRLVADGLVDAGDEVHVWCPPVEGERSVHDGVVVHTELGSVRPADLRRVATLLNQFPKPRRLLVQWVPHGYGYRSMNVPFCFWLWRRSVISKDRVDIMVHEPYLAFWEHSWRHATVALVHRLMTLLLLGAADRVWIAIPTWQQRWARYALGRRVPFVWLPVPSSISPGSLSTSSAREMHQRYVGQDGVLIGHFGTYGPGVAALLWTLIPSIMQNPAVPTLLLAGTGSDEFRRELTAAHPDLALRVHAVGHVAEAELATYLSACDLLIQPYPDGVSSRRTSAMAGLSLGRPIVTTRGHLTEPLWDDSRAVLLADVSNTQDFVAQVNRLLLDCGERQRLGDTGRTLYRERFDLRHTIAALRASIAA